MQPQLPRPVGINLLALNYLVIGCFGALFLPLLLWAASPAIHALIAQRIRAPFLSILVTCVVMTIWAGGYILYALTGYGMLRLRMWAWKAAVILHWVSIGLALVAIAVVARYDWMLSLSVGAISLLWFGGILYYLQRPRVRWPFDAANAIAQGKGMPSQPPPRTTPTWKIVTLAVTAFIVGVSVFVLGLFASIEKSFRSSTAYSMALNRAQESPCVAKTLGEPLVAKGFISGNLNSSSETGEADLDIPVHRSKASGNLHVEAKKTSGSWAINSLTLEHSEGQIHLAPVPSPCD